MINLLTNHTGTLVKIAVGVIAIGGILELIKVVI